MAIFIRLRLKFMRKDKLFQLRSNGLEIIVNIVSIKSYFNIIDRFTHMLTEIVSSITTSHIYEIELINIIFVDFYCLLVSDFF